MSKSRIAQEPIEMSPAIFQLEGKRAVVLGAGRGMGDECAAMLARAGCTVALLDIDAGRCSSAAERVRGHGREAIEIVADLLDAGQLEHTVAELSARLGSPQVVVSIVGQAQWKAALDLSLGEWENDHNRNLRYFFLYAQAIARLMVRSGGGGAITAITSVSGLQSAPNHAAYGAAKAGLVNLVKSLAVELAPHRIRVNAIAPGAIESPRIVEAMGAEEVRSRIARSLVPMRVPGQPVDIANAALFLSSAMASYITGHTLAVDGGLTAAFLLGA